jgi:hypothetical protein
VRGEVVLEENERGVDGGLDLYNFVALPWSTKLEGSGL